MGEGKWNNLWLRITDQSDVPKPAEEDQLPSPGMRLLAAALAIVMALIGLVLVLKTQDEIQLLYALLVLLSLIFAIANFMMWRKSRRRRRSP